VQKTALGWIGPLYCLFVFPGSGPEAMGMKPMEIKVNVDEKSGKITQLTVSADGVDMAAIQKALSSISKNLSQPGAPVSEPEAMESKLAELLADKHKYTIKERLRMFLKYEFRGEWFTTVQVKEKYGAMYGEEIKLSTVSTYLTRLFNEGYLERRGNRVEREYHVIAVNIEEKAVERAAQRPAQP